MSDHNVKSNPDGTVTVVSAGACTLTCLRDAAAQAFAERLERAVGWPTLLGTRELAADRFAATYVLEGS